MINEAKRKSFKNYITNITISNVYGAAYKTVRDKSKSNAFVESIKNWWHL